MDRRGFLAGFSAIGFAACAQPERQLLDDFAGIRLPLEPGDPRTTTTPTAPGSSPSSSTSSTTPTTLIDEPGLSFVAEATSGRVEITAEPDSSEVVRIFENPIPSGGPLVFLVDELTETDQIRVLLPTRPNGSLGWTSSDQVDLKRHYYAIQVLLDDFLLRVLERDTAIFETTVGVARDNVPTPLGRYYTTELLRPPRPNTAYGIYAYGLSGYSEVLTEFAGGIGQLGIHGTNDPATLGTNVSSGCIRMHNDDITVLVEQIGLPVGVPVEVL